jgi:hypothetical protein
VAALIESCKRRPDFASPSINFGTRWANHPDGEGQAHERFTFILNHATSRPSPKRSSLASRFRAQDCIGIKKSAPRNFGQRKTLNRSSLSTKTIIRHRRNGQRRFAKSREPVSTAGQPKYCHGKRTPHRHFNFCHKADIAAGLVSRLPYGLAQGSQTRGSEATRNGSAPDDAAAALHGTANNRWTFDRCPGVCCKIQHFHNRTRLPVPERKRPPAD